MGDILKVVIKRAMRILLLLFIGAYLVGCFAINLVMFHPRRGWYDERTPHYDEYRDRILEFLKGLQVDDVRVK